jgi:hypothetical protein
MDTTSKGQKSNPKLIRSITWKLGKLDPSDVVRTPPQPRIEYQFAGPGRTASMGIYLHLSYSYGYDHNQQQHNCLQHRQTQGEQFKI